MKKKLVLDLIMFILMFLLLLYDFVGGLWHEILGMSIFVLFIIHNINNISWIKTVTKNYNSMNKKIKIKYILTIILWITMISTMVTGILMSKFLFQINNISSLIFYIHEYSSYIMFGTIIIHVFVHLKIISAFMKKEYNINESFTSLVIILILIGSTIPVFYNIIKQNKILTNNKNNDKSNTNNNGNSSNNNDNITNPPITLEEYLSKLRCGQCHNNCLLSAIKCDRGTNKVEEATSDYYEIYNVNKEISSNNVYSEEYNGNNYSIYY